MGEELTRSLQVLAERGEVRGAAAVLEAARSEEPEEAALPEPTWQRGLVVAFGAAAAVLILVGAVVLLARPFGGEEIPPATDAPVVVTTLPATPIGLTESAGPLNEIHDLALAPDGSLWAGTPGGLVRWDTESGDFVVLTEEDGVPGRNIETLEIAPDGTVWIATNREIGRYDGSWRVYSEDNTPQLSGQLGALVVDQDGVVWVDVASEAIVRFDGSWAAVEPAPDGGWPAVTPDGLAVGADGTLWVGTHFDGIFAFDGSTWRHFDESDGAPARADRIVVALDGSVWTSAYGYYTDADLSEYVPGTGVARYDGAVWTTYTVDDGLLANEGSVVVGADGVVSAIHDELGPDHEPVPIGLSRFDGATWTTFSDVGDDPGVPSTGAVAGPDGIVWTPTETGIVGFDGADTIELIVPEEQATPPILAFTLTQDPESTPVRISTVVGDFEFTTVKPSPAKDILYVAGTPYGAVIPGENRLYWSEDYVTWFGTNLRRHQRWLTADGLDLVGFGDGFTRYSWNGQGWVEGATVDIRGDMQDIAFGPTGAVALVDSTVYYSTDGVDFVPTETGPTEVDSRVGPCTGTSPPIAGDGIGPVLVTEAGYVILGSADATWDSRAAELCEPLAWFSADGKTWELRTAESPFGPNAAIWDIAGFEGRFVAIGGRYDEPGNAVWTSDDGIDWHQVEVPQLESILGIAGGELGWFLSGQNAASGGGDGMSVDMWFSTDGLVWDGPYAGPEGLFWAFFRDEPSVGTDAILSINGVHDGIVIGRLEG